MNTADKKVIIDAITEASVCLAAIPDFMAGERITNALHQLSRAGAILERGEETDDSFFEVGARYKDIYGNYLELRKIDHNNYCYFTEIGSTHYIKNNEGFAIFFESDARTFTKL